MENKLASIRAMLNDGDDITSLFRKVFAPHNYDEGKRPVATVACGSARVDDTPKSLYRLLYLLEPGKIDFSDMYKSGAIFDLHSPDYHFCAEVQFFKYELGIYFHCAVKHRQGEGRGVIGRWPGADNGQSCADKVGNLWFGTLMTCLNHEFGVYPGNDFTV